MSISIKQTGRSGGKDSSRNGVCSKMELFHRTYLTVVKSGTLFERAGKMGSSS
jgi:hypothetical protein